jgi:hypothetical protein
MFIRVAPCRNAPENGGLALREDLANFWQNGFLMTIPPEGESENSHVFTGDLMVGLGGLEPPTSPLSGGLADRFRQRLLPKHC